MERQGQKQSPEAEPKIELSFWISPYLEEEVSCAAASHDFDKFYLQSLKGIELPVKGVETMEGKPAYVQIRVHDIVDIMGELDREYEARWWSGYSFGMTSHSAFRRAEDVYISLPVAIGDLEEVDKNYYPDKKEN